jgi:hypothetical protein
MTNLPAFTAITVLPQPHMGVAQGLHELTMGLGHVT